MRPRHTPAVARTLAELIGLHRQQQRAHDPVAMTSAQRAVGSLRG